MRGIGRAHARSLLGHNMNEIERFAEDLVLQHSNRHIVICADYRSCLTHGDFLRLVELVALTDASICLEWRVCEA